MTTTTATAGPSANAVREGVRRGVRELHQMVTNRQDLAGNLIWLFGMLAPLYFLRDNELPHSTMPVAGFILPSVMSMCLAFNGMFSLAQQLVVERQDGTLLRLKALPHGMLGYLIGKMTSVAATVLLACAIVTLTGICMLKGVSPADAGLWATLAWMLPLGLLAVLPAGAVLGSLVESPRNIGLIMIPLFGLASVSGIFYPASRLPEWVQHVAEVFPLYWIGLGARSALLPDGYAAVEIGASWRHWETAGVLGCWAVAGVLLAPAVLRRMARRESGSAMVSRRERALRNPV
ncbi:ABC transporter permease [Streptomyces achromogenes]|uniref:ABC transporter permease n=1 Tax=Streptomyces achromogenes TaxID=67255 RepID=UPI000B1D0388|nr:ABC transporter permease [Streptomyces achromogenes]